MNMKSLRIAAMTLLAPISWGTTYVTVTELLPDGRPLFVAAMRVAPAGIVLVLASGASARWRPRGRQWYQLATLAVFNFGIFFPLLIVAVYRLPGGVAAAVGGIQPLLVAVVTRALIGERPRPVDLAVGAAAASGVALVVIRPGAMIDPTGVVAAVGANVSFSIGVVLTRRFPAPEHRLAATGWQLVAGSVILVPLALVVEGPPPALTAVNLGGLAYLSLAATGGAFALWFNGIRRLPAPSPPLLGLAAPITGAALGWILLNQSLSPIQVTGFVVTLAAIAYGALLGSRHHPSGSHRRRRGAMAATAAARAPRRAASSMALRPSATVGGGPSPSRPRCSTRSP
jgi:probable blue pigment (indigoidine) exporter